MSIDMSCCSGEVTAALAPSISGHYAMLDTLVVTVVVGLWVTVILSTGVDASFVAADCSVEADDPDVAASVGVGLSCDWVSVEAWVAMNESLRVADCLVSVGPAIVVLFIAFEVAVVSYVVGYVWAVAVVHSSVLGWPSDES